MGFLGAALGISICLTSLRTIYYRAFIFHMLIGLGEDMTAIDFGLGQGHKGHLLKM